MDLVKALGFGRRALDENAVTYALYPGERGCAEVVQGGLSSGRLHDGAPSLKGNGAGATGKGLGSSSGRRALVRRRHRHGPWGWGRGRRTRMR